MSRVVIYARYSSDSQRDASIEDQIRVCRQRAEREGWTIGNCYTDHAISGASLMRPGIQMLIQDGLSGKFDIVLAETSIVCRAIRRTSPASTSGWSSQASRSSRFRTVTSRTCISD